MSLVQSISLLPWKASIVTVQVEEPQRNKLLLMEPSPVFTQANNSVCFGNSVVKISDDGHATIVLTNPTGFTQKLEKGVCIGQAMEASVVEAVSDVMKERDVAGELAVPVHTIASAPGLSERQLMLAMQANCRSWTYIKVAAERGFTPTYTQKALSICCGRRRVWYYRPHTDGHRHWRCCP